MQLGFKIFPVVESKGATPDFRDEGDFNHVELRDQDDIDSKEVDDQSVPPREMS